jgi:hypothetical protein
VVEDDFLSLALGMAGQDRAETRFAPEVVVRSLLEAYHRAAG